MPVERHRRGASLLKHFRAFEAMIRNVLVS
jgi:hypothetical protein